MRHPRRQLLLLSLAVLLTQSCRNNPFNTDCVGNVTTVTQNGRQLQIGGSFPEATRGEVVMRLTFPGGGKTTFVPATHDSHTEVFNLGDLAAGTYPAGWFISCADNVDETVATGPSTVTIH